MVRYGTRLHCPVPRARTRTYPIARQGWAYIEAISITVRAKSWKRLLFPQPNDRPHPSRSPLHLKHGVIHTPTHSLHVSVVLFKPYPSFPHPITTPHPSHSCPTSQTVARRRFRALIRRRKPQPSPKSEAVAVSGVSVCKKDPLSAFPLHRYTLVSRARRSTTHILHLHFLSFTNAGKPDAWSNA